MNERNESGKSPLHAACYNGNMDIVKVLVHHNSHVNEQDHDAWTPLEAAAQEGHQDIVNYLALNGADIDGLTSLHAAANAGNLNAIKCISSHRGGPDEGETEDPRSGGNQNLITRGYVPVSLKDAETHLRKCQLPPRVDSAEEWNDCDQPDPMLHQIEAMKNPVTRNDADGSSPHGFHTWQYCGFDPPYLQATETDHRPSEEPESRCHSLIDENRDMRVSGY